MYDAQLGLNDLQYAAVAPPFTTSISFTNNKTSNLPADYFGNGVSSYSVAASTPSLQRSFRLASL